MTGKQAVNVLLLGMGITLLLVLSTPCDAAELERIAITNVDSGSGGASGSAIKRRVTSSRDLMQSMPASLKPRPGSDWTREDNDRISNWLSTMTGSPFQATLEVQKVDIGEASFSEKRDYENESLWRVRVFFEPRKILYLGVTIVETVDPVTLFGNENYARAAQRLRTGSRVRVKGDTSRFSLRSDSVTAKTELLTIYLDDGDVLSSALPKTLLAIRSKNEKNAPAPGWAGRQKSGSFWSKADIESFKPSVSKGVLTITHTQEAGGYLTYDKRQLRGDFTVQAIVSGTGNVGIIDTSAIDASDFNVAVNSEKPITIRINRTGKNITFTVDGKDKKPRKGNRADAQTTQLFFVAVPKDESLQLHRVEMSK